jgi:hypothetical protein
VKDGQPSADEYWENAVQCEEKARHAEVAYLQTEYLKLATEWRAMALKTERGY